MYNRYIPNGASYTRIPEEDAAGAEPSAQGADRRAGGGAFSIPPFLSGEGGLGSLLQALKLEHLDTGDILLLLIVLLLLLEGDNLELVIALGLVLIMGLGEEK